MFGTNKLIKILKHPWTISWVLISLGITVRLVQYLSNRPLWIDEAMLTQNILTRSFRGLFTPLEYEQQAPMGFLLIEKLLVTLFGNAEVVLRAFPFVASVASLVAMATIALDVLPLPFAYIAQLLFVLSVPLIVYA